MMNASINLKKDATDKLGLTSYNKIALWLRMLVYGVASA
jgi:hypothetical protein